MSRREDIDNAIWSDPDFEALSPHATLLYLWSFTNPRCGMAGIYRVSHRAMTECKVPLEHIPGALAELEAAGFAFYHESVLWIRTRVKHLRSRSPQMATGVIRDVESLDPQHPLVERWHATYGADPWLRDALKQRVSRTHTDPSENLSEKTVGKGVSDRFPPPSTEGAGKGPGQRQGPSSTEDVSGSVRNHARAKVELPKGFPAPARPHLTIVWRVLVEVTERHNLPEIKPLALANVVIANAHKPLVAEVYRYVAWLEDQPEVPHKNLVQGFGRWLKKSSDLVGFEELGTDGLPAGAIANSNGHHRIKESSPEGMAMRLGALVTQSNDSTIVDATCEEEA